MAAWTLPAIILDRCEFVTTALDRRSRKYFFNIILGMILICGRRTVSSWLRASDVGKDWQDHYYFLQTLGRSSKRYGKKVELAGKHHNPTPGPSIAEFLFGHANMEKTSHYLAAERTARDGQPHG